MRDNEFLIVISTLFQYPDKELVEYCKNEGIPDIDNIEVLNNINYFLDYFINQPLEILQQNYVDTFDFNDEISLYLTYSKEIECGIRSEKLVDLKNFYKDNDLLIEAEELPDYYPLMLEFMSITDKKVVKELYAIYSDAINNLMHSLGNISSPYEKLVNASVLIINNLED